MLFDPSNNQTGVRAINPRGDIAGVGFHNGNMAVYALIPITAPEPSTLTLAASGLGLLAFAWRRRKLVAA